MTATTRARGRVRVEHGAKRIRAYLAGELVADTTRPLLVWEKPYYPTYYFPVADVRTDLLSEDGAIAHSPSRGDAKIFTVRAGRQERAGAALLYERSPFDELHETIRLDWSAMDAWFEEDEEVFTHPRDPYTRVDILPSSRHVRVEVDGVTVAESTKPTLLLETGLPARYYLPKTDVRMDLLAPTPTSSHCPYKGQADYWSLSLGDKSIEDIAWSYRTPLPESQKIAGLVCFYPAKVDLYVDGRSESRRSRQRAIERHDGPRGPSASPRARRLRMAPLAQAPQRSHSAATANLEQSPTQEQQPVTITKGLIVRLEAKPGQQDAVAAFLRDAVPLVQEEPKTVAWFAFQTGASSFAIVDVFPDEDGRRAHLEGAVAAALEENGLELLAQPPLIENVDVLAMKLP